MKEYTEDSAVLLFLPGSQVGPKVQSKKRSSSKTSQSNEMKFRTRLGGVVLYICAKNYENPFLRFSARGRQMFSLTTDYLVTMATDLNVRNIFG